MKNQWTTVNDPVQSESANAVQSVAEEATPPMGNRKMALAMASVGVFLIMIGAAPFLFGDDASQDYSAFLGQPVTQNSGAQIAIDDEAQDPASAEEMMVDEPEIIDIVDPEAPADEGGPVEPDPIMDPLPVIPPVPVVTPEPEGSDDDQGGNEQAGEPAGIPPIQVPIIVPPQDDPEPAMEDEPEATIISELVDYPIITGSVSADPRDLARIATSEQMHSAAPQQPGTGLPVLPLLAFSGAAAYFWRQKRTHQ